MTILDSARACWHVSSSRLESWKAKQMTCWWREGRWGRGRKREHVRQLTRGKRRSFRHCPCRPAALHTPHLLHAADDVLVADAAGLQQLQAVVLRHLNHVLYLFVCVGEHRGGRRRQHVSHSHSAALRLQTCRPRQCCGSSCHTPACLPPLTCCSRLLALCRLPAHALRPAPPSAAQASPPAARRG